MKPTPWDTVESRMATWRDGMVRSLRRGRECRLLDLLDVTIAVEGDATPEAAEVADWLREHVAEVKPGPDVVVVGQQRNCHARRWAAARA